MNGGRKGVRSIALFSGMNISPVSSSGNFMVFTAAIKALIDFELILKCYEGPS